MRLSRRKNRKAPKWTTDHLEQLKSGHDWFGSAWGWLDTEHSRNGGRPKTAEELAATMEDIRDCWAQYGAQITFEYIETHGRASRPWGWWQFDAPRQPERGEPEWHCLWKLGEIDEDTAREYGIRDAENALRNVYHSLTLFRRPIGWWLFVSTEPRDESKPELVQLRDMGALVPRELAILAGDAKEMRAGSGMVLSHYLTPEESALVKTPHN